MGDGNEAAREQNLVDEWNAQHGDAVHVVWWAHNDPQREEGRLSAARSPAYLTARGADMRPCAVVLVKGASAPVPLSRVEALEQRGPVRRDAVEGGRTL